MITEFQRLCSDKQSVTATADSTNVLDNGYQTRVYEGVDHFLVKVENATTTDLVGTSSPTFTAEVKTCATNSGTAGDWSTIATTAAMSPSDIAAKKDGIVLDVKLAENPATKRFVKVVYTIGGTWTSGKTPKVTAGEFTEAPPSHVKNFAVKPPVNV